MMSLLQQAVNLGLLRALDYHLARLIAGENQPLLAFLVARVSFATSLGHVCLPLQQLDMANGFASREPDLATAIWQAAGEPSVEQCLHVLRMSAAVSDGQQPTPLVLNGERLYLQRLWQDEGKVAEFFRANSRAITQDYQRLPAILAGLFGPIQAEVDWQKVAVAVAATSQVSIISGGPGTGKTTTVARLLITLIRLLPDSKLRIKLAAPTGKAAARLSESLGLAMRQLSLSQEEWALVPTEASTLHRLLGAERNTMRLRYHENNPLHLDVLIVDEASMVDLPMMACLIAALPMGVKLILLGDRDQLASVEAGAVLGDLGGFAQYGFSRERAEQLSDLTDYQLSHLACPSGATVRDSLCLLRTSYRFNADSGISQLATSVNQGEVKAALACLQQNKPDIAWHSLQQQGDFIGLLSTVVEGYRDYLECIQRRESSITILSAFNRFQVLCALRHGPYGVNGLNQRIEQALFNANLIDRPAKSANLWYEGRPVIIESNDSSLGLFNGDIGIALRDTDGQLRVHFSLSEGGVRSVQPNRLPEHGTAYAMTVHKAQGSEFEHTLLVLPDTPSRLLTRELLYTAITRARKKLTLYANRDIFTLAIQTRTQRHSGLVERLTT